MNKKVIGIVVVVAVILLAVLAWIMLGKKAKAPQTPQNPVQTLQNAANPASKIVSSIKDAMGLGTQMKCTYKAKDGDSSLDSTVYVQGSKYMSVMDLGGKTLKAVFDGDTVYTWTEGTTAGTKFAMSCMNDLKSSLPQDKQDDANSPIKNPADEFNSAMDTKCSPSSEADFSIPSNVTFTDQCEMLKKSLEMMKSVKLPANMPDLPANIPGMPSGVAQ